MNYLIKYLSHDGELHVDLLTPRQFRAMVAAASNGLLTILAGMEVRS